MIKCGWCGVDTLQIYVLKDSKSLCVECATKHYELVKNKMTQHIQEVQNGLNNRANNLLRLKRQMCKHENLRNTNYCKWTDKIMYIYRCSDCGKEILKDTNI